MRLRAFFTLELSLSEAFWRDFALTPLPSDARLPPLLVAPCFVDTVVFWRLLGPAAAP